MNKIEIIGNLTAAPTLGKTKSEKDVTSFTVAVNEGSGDHKTVQFFRVTAYEQKAMLCMQYLQKGSKVYVRGRAASHAWVDKTGTACSGIDITLGEIEFLSSRQYEQDEAAARASGGDPGQAAEPQFTPVTSDELPF